MSNLKDHSNSLHYELSGPFIKLQRVWRSIKMWGVHRTYAKTLNRLSIGISPVFSWVPRTRDIVLVGCGQFGLTTASFFMSKKLGNRFLGCYDIDEMQSRRAQDNYGYKFCAESFEDLLDLEGAKFLFVASNHASHTSQTIAGLNKGMKVHVEKPISVSWDQLADLCKAVKGKEDLLFVGYNRPFAKATQILREKLSSHDHPFTIQYFIAGHAIAGDHWYYDPKEGTRICGNVGHWIDLTVHLLSQSRLADRWNISLICSDDELREENFSLSMSSDKGDLVTMTFTARGEPFDGVSESINLQHGNVMAKIEDYQTMKLWDKNKFKQYRFWPKDVGHKTSVVQMFEKNPRYQRPWSEVLLSTMLMLHITDMVKSNINTSTFSFSDAETKIKDNLNIKSESQV
jgi:predicted dehydrogenase